VPHVGLNLTDLESIGLKQRKVVVNNAHHVSALGIDEGW